MILVKIVYTRYGSSLLDNIANIHFLVAVSQMLYSSFSWKISGQVRTKKILSSSLFELGFEQKVSDVTHNKGGLIDHVCYRGGEVSYNAEVSLYSPCYIALDHDGLSVTLTHVSLQKYIDSKYLLVYPYMYNEYISYMIQITLLCIHMYPTNQKEIHSTSPVQKNAVPPFFAYGRFIF